MEPVTMTRLGSCSSRKIQRGSVGNRNSLSRTYLLLLSVRLSLSPSLSPSLSLSLSLPVKRTHITLYNEKKWGLAFVG